MNGRYCDECGHPRSWHCDWLINRREKRAIPEPRPCAACGCDNLATVYKEDEDA